MRPDIVHNAVRRRAGEIPDFDALSQRAAATRNAELARLLRFAAGRRLNRLGQGAVDQGDAAEMSEPRAALAAAGGAPVLLRRHDVAANLLRLEVSRPADFDYLSGQHVKLGVPGLLRTYSLVSAPHESDLEFFVEVFPEGRLSVRLQSLAAGAAMALGGRAKGKLAFDLERRRHLLVATVTGIAPYVSMLRDHFRDGGARNTPAAGGHHFVVLHGASFADEFGYAAELGEMSRRHPDALTYIPTVSRPESPRNAGWTGARGRVEAHLDDVVRRYALSPQETEVMACGNPGMVGKVAGIMRRRGYPTQTEPFD